MIQIDIPMPEGCDVCPLNYDFCWCGGLKEGDNSDDEWSLDFDFTKRPGWCPLEEQPGIIRCNDCKWFSKETEKRGMCILHDYFTREPDWFCADGERRQ